MIPQYYTFKELYSKYLLGKEIHSCLTHRFSNDVMFIGYDTKMKGLYNQMSKLWVILETMTELFNDNPLYRCNTLITDTVYIPRVVASDLEGKYTDYFNKLFICLNITIDNIKSCKKGLSSQYIIERCEIQHSVGGVNGNTGCILGDYNNDYNNDYFVEKCNTNTTLQKI